MRGYHFNGYESLYAWFGSTAASPTSYAFGFQLASDNSVYAYAGGAIYGSVAAPADGYYTWMVVYNGKLSGNANRLKLYRDGVQQTLVFTGTVPATLPSTINRLDIGRFWNTDGTPYYSWGWYWYVALYDYALSSTMVKLLSSDITPENNFVLRYHPYWMTLNKRRRYL